MQINFYDLEYCEYMAEIQKQQAFYKKRGDLETKNKILKEIGDAEKAFEKNIIGLEYYEQDSLILDFQEFRSDKMLEYYHAMTSIFQKMYSIFENQLAKNGYKKFPFENYPILNEMNLAVNVLKHGEGPSYDKLKSLGSKFLDQPKEFPNIIDGASSTIILNFEFEDLMKFCDSAVDAWYDRMIDKRQEREGKTNENLDTRKK